MKENNDMEKQPAPATPAAKEAVSTVEASTLTSAQVDELKQRAAKAEENWDRLLRTTADFDNFKKRAARERQDAVKFANMALMEKLVPVLDTFDIALAAPQSKQAEAAQSLLAGVKMVHQQLKSALVDGGLEEIDATGKPFDPHVHEALSQQESSTVPEGHVLQQLRKGYKLRERLLRPASVIVAKAPASTAK